MGQTITQQAGVMRAALVALTEHIAEHDIPLPISIDLPDAGEPPYLRVRVAGLSGHQAWIDSAHLDGEDVVAISPGKQRVVFHLRLPDTGTRIEMVGLRRGDSALIGVAS